MSLNIRLFGMLAEAAGNDSLTIRPVTDTGALRREVLNVCPQLSGFRFLVAVGRDIANESTPIPAGSELALLPPFAGG